MDDVVVVSGRSRLLQLLLAALSSSPAPASKVIGKKKNSCNKRVLHLDDDGAYECRSCGRRFKTFQQALGGHRTSHKRRPPTAGRKLGKTAPAAEHRCGTCGLVFATGQALGGHMRRHFKRPPATWTPSSTSGLLSAAGGREEDDDDAWAPRLIQFI